MIFGKIFLGYPAGVLGYPPGYHDRKLLIIKDGGGRGIRTPGTLSSTAVFKTACFNRSHIPPRFRSGLHSLVYSTFGFFGIGVGCTLVAHRRFERLHCRQTARIGGIGLDVRLPRYADVAVPQNRLDHDVGHAQLMQICG